MAFTRLLLTFYLLCTVKLVKSEEVKTYAVVVGISKYLLISPLEYADDDAYDFYAHLQSVEGGSIPYSNIRILVDEDATKSKILAALKSMLGKASKTDRVIFFFSGHGTKGAFYTYDPNGYSNTLYHSEISQLLKNCSAKFKICIADACFSGSFTKGRSTTNYSEYYKDLMNSSGGYALLMSSKAEETSIEYPEKRRGIFTFYLIKGLKGAANLNADNIITITELYRYLKKNVGNYTAQEQNPTIYGDYDVNMPVSMIDSKNMTHSASESSFDFENSISDTGPDNSTSQNKSRLSIAFDDIDAYTEVYVDGINWGKVAYLFPNDHPGCRANGTLNAAIKPGKHNVKVISNNKVLDEYDINIQNNECYLLYLTLARKPESNSYGTGFGNLCLYTNHKYVVDIWVGGSYIGETREVITRKRVHCGDQGTINIRLKPGLYEVRAKEQNGKPAWNFETNIREAKCNIHKLKSRDK